MAEQNQIKSEKPGVIQVRIHGDDARMAARTLSLPAKIQEPELQERFEREKQEELAARKAAGLSPKIPKANDMFAKLFSNGIPDANISALILEIAADGYFLIAADLDMTDEPRVRFAFSRKDEDRPLRRSTPTTEQLHAFFEDKTWPYGHVHDQRRTHPGDIDPQTGSLVPGTARQVGNNLIDLCGSLKNKETRKPVRRIHYGPAGAEKDGLYSFDVVTRNAPPVTDSAEERAPSTKPSG